MKTLAAALLVLASYGLTAYLDDESAKTQMRVTASHKGHHLH